jgi:hypothetical protein
MWSARTRDILTDDRLAMVTRMLSTGVWLRGTAGFVILDPRDPEPVVYSYIPSEPAPHRLVSIIARAGGDRAAIFKQMRKTPADRRRDAGERVVRTARRQGRPGGRASV